MLEEADCPGQNEHLHSVSDSRKEEHPLRDRDESAGRYFQHETANVPVVDQLQHD